MSTIPEREFIRGNRDGPNRRNETYTVCRIDVPLTRLDAESKARLHPSYLEHQVTTGWRCPAHSRAMPNFPASFPDYIKKVPFLKEPTHELEVVHLPKKQPGDKEATCVICRLKVHRGRLVEEVKADLHPDFKVVNGYVQEKGKPGDLRDNVNHPCPCDFCLLS